jgi:hypothetical protein
MWPGWRRLRIRSPTTRPACETAARPQRALRRSTLVATGGTRQPGAASWVLALDPAADAIAASIPRAERRTIEGQTHVADPTALAPVLERFFRG